MTVPYEEELAIKSAWVFLFDVMSAKRVPKALRERARNILRHYPGPASTEITYRNARGKKTTGAGE
jgi:hypothetical protein